MASAMHAQILFNDSQCQFTPDLPNSATTPTTLTRHQMQREKLSLQEMISEYYGLLLEEFERRVDNSPSRIEALNDLLACCQQHLGRDSTPAAEITDAGSFRFWCQFHATIDQYCQLQHRLFTFPATVGQWQMERSIPVSQQN